MKKWAKSFALRHSSLVTDSSFRFRHSGFDPVSSDTVDAGEHNLPSLGILVPEFPQQTHIFFWREIVALRKLGVPVRLYSTRRAEVGACRHAFAEAAAGVTQ
jgi:hypothetical protein